MIELSDQLDALARRVGRELSEDERQAALKRFGHIAVMAAPEETVGQPPVVPLGDYLDTDIPEPPAVIDPGLFVRGSLTLLTSPASGAGKTAMSMNRILRWAGGKPLFDTAPELLVPRAPVKTLIIENEGAAGLFHLRVTAMAQHLCQTEEELELVRSNVFIWGDGGYSGLKLDDKSMVELVRRGIESCEPDLVLLEPLRGLWVGDENSSTELATVMDALHGIANDYDLAVQLTHHERKSGAGESGEDMFAVRGSVILSDLAAVVERWKSVQNGAQRELYWTKCRYGQKPSPVRMQFDPVTWCYSHVSEDLVERETLKVLTSAKGAWFSVADVAEETGESRDKQRKVLNKLAEDNRCAKTQATGGGGFVYRVTGADDEDEGMGF